MWIHFDMSEIKAKVNFHEPPDIFYDERYQLYVLIDAASTHHHQSFNFGYHTLVVSSPNQANYSSLYKVHSSIKTWYMPTWSWKEIEMSHLMECYKHLSSDVISSRFERFGGIPRIIFELNFSRYEDFCLLQENIIESCSIQTLKQIHSKIDTGKCSHMIFHQVVEEYKLVCLDFPTECVKNAVYDYVDENERADLEQLVYSTSDIFATKIFTGFAHHWLAKQRKGCLRRLTTEKDSEEVSTLTRQMSNMSLHSLDISEEFSGISNNYYLVLDKPLDSIHALGKAACYQMTVELTGFIFHQDLVTAYKKLKCDGNDIIKFYFVVPQKNFEDFKFGFFKNTENKEITGNFRLFTLTELYILGLNFHDSDV